MLSLVIDQNAKTQVHTLWFILSKEVKSTGDQRKCPVTFCTFVEVHNSEEQNDRVVTMST